jgi:hypothetical protein
MRKTKAMLEQELDECKAAGQRLQGDLAFARKALDAEKKLSHSLSLQVSDCKNEQRKLFEAKAKLELEYKAFKTGAITMLSGDCGE